MIALALLVLVSVEALCRSLAGLSLAVVLRMLSVVAFSMQRETWHASIVNDIRYSYSTNNDADSDTDTGTSHASCVPEYTVRTITRNK